MADVNQDGQVDVIDSTWIAECVAGTPNGLCLPENLSPALLGELAVVGSLTQGIWEPVVGATSYEIHWLLDDEVMELDVVSSPSSTFDLAGQRVRSCTQAFGRSERLTRVRGRQEPAWNTAHPLPPHLDPQQSYLRLRRH